MNDISKLKQSSQLDQRVLSVVKEDLYGKDMVIGFVVVNISCIIFWWHFVSWPEPPLLIATLLLWWLNSIFYLTLYIYHRSQPKVHRQQSDQTQKYLNLVTISRGVDSAVAGILLLLMYTTFPSWELVLVIGASLYLQGTFIKNMAYSKITMLVPFLILAPLTVAFFLKNDPLHTTIAIYLTLSLIGLTIYAPNIAKTIHEPIKQRFQMEELAQQLNFERDRADTANIAKSKFFTAASHDARQPLQVISLLFQSFQKSAQASAEDKKIIEKIALNLTTIRNLFDRVLDISRIDAGKVVPVRQTFELQKIFDKFDAQFGELAATKGLWMRFVPTNVVIEHDLELLERILSNLIHNAIKYTPSGGVWVAWRSMRGRLEIRDSGLGIAKEDQEAIFQEFAQINNPARNNEAGLGLGLSIVKRLAALSDTAIGVNSSLGKGSTFWIQLKTQSQAVAVPVLEHQKSEMSTDAGPNPIQNGDKTLAGVQILYVEDEEQIRELIVQLLNDAGAFVHSYSNVSDAIEFIQTSPNIDVVLTDYRLGVTGSGLDVVNAARMNGNGHGKPTIHAVILTGDTAVKDLISIQQLPNSRLLHKPVDFSDLVIALKN